jgi:hypothetical protein
LLADRVAPPRKIDLDYGKGGFVSVLLYFVLIPAGPIFLGVLFRGNSYGAYLLGGILGGWAVAFFLSSRLNARIGRKNAHYNETVYKPALIEWESKFYCHRCDTVFQPNV